MKSVATSRQTLARQSLGVSERIRMSL
eukprot:COSAG03_NODE_29514_length_182_cov_2275.746988_1_plen_26_part_10